MGQFVQIYNKKSGTVHHDKMEKSYFAKFQKSTHILAKNFFFMLVFICQSQAVGPFWGAYLNIMIWRAYSYNNDNFHLITMEIRVWSLTAFRKEGVFLAPFNSNPAQPLKLARF